jgi:hypothetical protein
MSGCAGRDFSHSLHTEILARQNSVGNPVCQLAPAAL